MIRGNAGRLAAAAVIALCCAGTGALTPAHAVIDGKFDGNEHPNVGMIMAIDGEGGGLSCTGTLVAPSIVLTAAHCIADEPGFPPFQAFYVSFEPIAYEEPPQRPLQPPLNPIEGTPDPHPDWNWAEHNESRGIAAFLRDQEKDVGLLHLAEPAASAYPGITPAPIVEANGLASLAKRRRKPTLMQVGYGTQRDGAPGQGSSLFVDGTRNQSRFPLGKLRERFVFGHANPNDAHGYGMPCYGDSGSPWYVAGDDAVIGVYTAVFGTCNNVGAATRLDTGPARAFLRSRGLVP